MRNKLALYFYSLIKALFLFSEQAFQALWPLFFLVLTYLGFLNLGLDRHYNLHLISFILLSIVTILLLYKFTKKLQWPSRIVILRKIEHDNQLAHNPLLSKNDRLISGNPNLWIEHIKSIKAPSFLTLSRPRFSVDAKKDPYAIRFFVLLFFVITFYFGDGRIFFDKAYHSFFPPVSPPIIVADEQARQSVTGWIFPPEYTAKMPTVLNADTPQPLIAPTGSQLSLQIDKKYWFFKPEIQLSDDRFDHFTLDKESGLYTYQTVLNDDDLVIKLRIGWFNKMKWHLFVDEDHAPSVYFAKPPVGTNDGDVMFNYTYQDDYSVESIKLKITRAQSLMTDNEGEEVPNVEYIDLPLRTPKTIGAQDITMQHKLDFARSIWAGTPVLLQLIAKDAIEQRAESDEILFIIPEREFRHPIAQELMITRRDLITNYARHRPMAVVRALEYMNMPTLYQDDFGLFLSLSSLFNRLRVDVANRQRDSISELIWDIALTLDKDQMEREKEQLDRLLAEMMEALEKGDDETVQKLIEELESKLFDYQQALFEFLQNHAEEMPLAIGENSGLDALTDQNINSAMNRLRELAQAGSKQDLRNAIQHLKDFMAGLQKPQPANLTEQQKLALQQLQDLDAIIRQQDAIRNKTRMNVERKVPDIDGALTEQQKGLNAFFSELLTQCQGAGLSIPNSLPMAMEMMDETVNALNAPDFAMAQEMQEEILFLLQSGQEQLAQEIQSQMNMRIFSGVQQNNNPLMPQGRRDPFGRPVGGDQANGLAGNPLMPSGVQIPDEFDIQETQRIQNELRRRSGERRRPEQELDYIRRLLNRF